MRIDSIHIACMGICSEPLLIAHSCRGNDKNCEILRGRARSRTGVIRISRKSSEPNVMTTTLHNHIQFLMLQFDIIFLTQLLFTRGRLKQSSKCLTRVPHPRRKLECSGVWRFPKVFRGCWFDLCARISNVIMPRLEETNDERGTHSVVQFIPYVSFCEESDDFVCQCNLGNSI